MSASSINKIQDMGKSYNYLVKELHITFACDSKGTVDFCKFQSSEIQIRQKKQMVSSLERSRGKGSCTHTFHISPGLLSGHETTEWDSPLPL